ncbi:MAG TPA: glycosyltransferase [Longimicrobiales bacterium]|nr:glycosyltransferase [Longimicrobiales bacterium]
MKLLYLNHNVVGTGTYLRALHLGMAMAGRGHEVTLVTTSRDRRWSAVEREERGVRVIEAPDLWFGPARTGWDPWNTLQRVLRLRRTPVDLIHAFDSRPVVALPAVVLARRAKAALVMDWADWWGRGGQIQQRSGWLVRTFFGPLETWFEESFRPVAGAHTVISNALYHRAVALGLDPARVTVIPNGCQPALIRELDRSEARAALGLVDGPFIAAHLGRLTPADMAFLMSAWRIVWQHQPGSTLVLAGRPGCTVPADLMEAGAVRVTGFVDAADRDRWLGAADACLVALPDTIGNRGRWPSKINDYLGAGRATIITDVGDAADLVRTAGLGHVTPATPEGFARGIVNAAGNRALLDESGRRARLLAEGDLAWPALAARVEAIYAGAVEGASTPRASSSGS